MSLLSNQGAGDMQGESIIQTGSRRHVRLFYYPIRGQETCKVILLSNQGAGDMSGEFTTLSVAIFNKREAVPLLK